MKYILELNIYVDTNDDINISLTPLIGTFDLDTIKLSNESYIPNKGDKLYFLPNVDIPRIKLKDLNINNGIKTVRNIEDATHIFGSTSTIHEIISTDWYYSISTDNLKKLFELIKDKLDEKDIESINTALEFYDNDQIIMKYGTANEIKNEGVFYDVRIRVPEIMTELLSSEKFLQVKKEYKELYDYIKDKTIINEESLITILNGPDCVTIDNVMFKQLSEMFQSSDKDNHILAMEIMANCNYLDSLLYLEMLFKNYSYIISESHTKKHVNFKSLVKYLNKSINYLNTTLDDIIKSLLVKNVLTADKLNILLDSYSVEINNSGDTAYFQVKSITVNEEIAKKLNLNYVYSSLGDYEVQESEIILEELNIQTYEEIVEFKETANEDFEPEADLNNLTICKESSEEEVVHELYGVDNDNIEVTLTTQPEIINQIKETNDTDDFEWF